MSLKHDLLFELESNRNTDLSGQALAEKFGVSRSAVWKAVNALKQDGYEILSGTNKGYRLAEDSDLLSAEGVRKYLPEDRKELPIFFFREIDSTNSEAKRMLAGGFGETALIVAERQSEGRGRLGRSFYSPGRTGIYATLVIHPETGLADSLSATTASAVAVVRAVEKLTDKKPMIKWVNDLYLDGKKFGGILTEAFTDFETGTVHSMVIGIGLNISTAVFPAPLGEIAASLQPAGVTRSQLLAEIVGQLLPLTRNFADKSYLEDYRKHSMVLNRKISYRDGNETLYATAVGIDDGGGLVIRNEDGGTGVLRSGEISVRLA